MTRIPARPALAVSCLVLVSTSLRFAVARAFDVPWIAPDEMIYGLVGESLWQSGELSIRGIATPYYSLLTPALVGLPLTLDDREAGLAVAQLLQALAMSLAAVPVYLWGKSIVGRDWALVAAGLAVLPPALWYGGLLMTEALFYPAIAAALLALARMLERPTLERQGVFFLALSIAAAVRLQALILLPALLVAVGLYAWFARSRAIVVRLAPTLGLVAFAVVVLGILYASGSDDLLGAYGALASSTPSSSGIVAQLAWHAAGLALLTLVLPLLATATLVVLAGLRGEPDPGVRALLAVTTAYVAVLLGQVSLFAVDHLDHVSERYLITALPPILLVFVVWAAHGAPRPRRLAVGLALVAVALVATLPGDRVGSAGAAHDALTTMWFVESVQPGETTLVFALALFTAAGAAAFVLLPARHVGVAAAGVATAFLVVSAFSGREIDDFSGVERRVDVGNADATWVDDAGAADVLLFDTGEVQPTAIDRLVFWNRSIRQLVRLETVPEQALPQIPVAIRRDGALTDQSTAEVSASQAIVPAPIVLAGEPIAESPPTELAPGLRLWRVDEPLRIVSRATGFSPVGDFRQGTVVVYRCGPGALELDLLGKDGEPVVVKVNGFPFETYELRRLGKRTVSVRSLITTGEPCVFELQSAGLVGSTRVEWVPAGR